MNKPMKMKQVLDTFIAAGWQDIDLMDDLIEEIVCESIDGIVLWANRAACESAARPRSELIGKKYSDIWPDTVGENRRSPLTSTPTAGKTSSFEHQTSDGRYWLMRVRDVCDGGGHPVGRLHLRLEITERRKLQAQLSRAYQLEAIGTLAGGIAHDFNNILTPMIIHTEIALSKLTGNAAMQQHLDKVLQASKRARSLIDQILAFSRPGEFGKKPFRVSIIVKEALKLLRSSLPTTIHIQKEIVSKEDTVVGDPTDIHQLLMNLCTNAGHAMKEYGGVLTVCLQNETVSPTHPDPRLHHLKAGCYLKLIVNDTGCGIQPMDLKRIYEPYFTTKAKGDGTGLGLARVHRIVSDYGGCILVESSPQQGTTFEVLLPTTSQKAKTSHPSPRTPRGGREQILFVDDEKMTVDAVKEMLKTLGYGVMGQTSSLTALRTFRRNPQRFDLVITDQTMPQMTGLELSKALLEIRPDIPIILTSGYSELIDESRLRKTGIRHFLLKPFEIHEMAEKIRLALMQ